MVIKDDARLSLKDAFEKRWEMYSSPPTLCTKSKRPLRPLYNKFDDYITFVVDVLGIDFRSTYKRVDNSEQARRYNVLLDGICIQYEVLSKDSSDTNHVNVRSAGLLSELVKIDDV